MAHFYINDSSSSVICLSQCLPQFLEIIIFTVAYQYVIRTNLGILGQFVHYRVLYQRNALAILDGIGAFQSYQL